MRRLAHSILSRLGIGLSRIRVQVQLLSLLPEFYRIYQDNSKRIWGYQVRGLADELNKVSAWHSNWLGLIDYWQLDAEFNEIFREASRAPGSYKMRCFILYEFLKHIGNLEGDAAEVGVHKGRSAKVIALTSRNLSKEVHLFDTFTGMPETDPSRDNFYTKGAFADTSLETVKAFLSDCDNVNIYPGFFPDTAGPTDGKTFSFVHVDVDIYRSVLDCCQFFYPRMTRAGIMIFDDPGFADCSGAKAAVDEFFADKEEFPAYLATAQVLVIKK